MKQSIDLSISSIASLSALISGTSKRTYKIPHKPWAAPRYVTCLHWYIKGNGTPLFLIWSVRLLNCQIAGSCQWNSGTCFCRILQKYENRYSVFFRNVKTMYLEKSLPLSKMSLESTTRSWSNSLVPVYFSTNRIEYKYP